MNPNDIGTTLANAAHNKSSRGLLWMAGIAITVFSGIALWNQTKMHKVQYLKTQLDIEKLRREGISLPPKSPKA